MFVDPPPSRSSLGTIPLSEIPTIHSIPWFIMHWTVATVRYHSSARTTPLQMLRYSSHFFLHALDERCSLSGVNTVRRGSALLHGSHPPSQHKRNAIGKLIHRKVWFRCLLCYSVAASDHTLVARWMRAFTKCSSDITVKQCTNEYEVQLHYSTPTFLRSLIKTTINGH